MRFETLDRWAPWVLSVLRIIAGLLFLQSGLAKYFGFPSPPPGNMTALLYVQGIIEILGGILLTIGLFTRYAAFIMSGDMAAAYFIAHLPRSFFPLANNGGLAVLFCFLFLYIFFAGPGPWSVDTQLRSRRAEPAV
jgi:putative oxidoreductase